MTSSNANAPTLTPELTWITVILGTLAFLSLQYGARFPHSQFQLEMLSFACGYWGILIPFVGWWVERRHGGGAPGETAAVFACLGFFVLIFIGFSTAQPPPTSYIGRP